MMKNPFRFGSVVEGKQFINRSVEIEKVLSILNSKNHLILISPRRFGKTSLIKNVLKSVKRSSIYIDLQLITSVEDLSAQLLKQIYRIHPFEKFKTIVKSLKIIPTLNMNPINNEIEISFQTNYSDNVFIEDTFNLIERISKKGDRTIVVIDEFQNINSFGKNVSQQLRSIIQHHQKVNYVFLGSQESLMRQIFESKKSPFYHFGYLMVLDKLPLEEFEKYLNRVFAKITDDYKKISNDILEITKAHPYYTQQLAFTVFELLHKKVNEKKITELSVDEIIQTHDIDFERLWNSLNRTDMKILIGMISTDASPLSSEYNMKNKIGATSTIFSSLKRLQNRGIIIQSNSGYEIDDPFFKKWIEEKRNMKL